MAKTIWFDYKASPEKAKDALRSLYERGIDPLDKLPLFCEAIDASELFAETNILTFREADVTISFTKPGLLRFKIRGEEPYGFFQKKLESALRKKLGEPRCKAYGPIAEVPYIW
ncbi:MAG: hypothetical protein QXU82_01225 [Candidatus Aenigmatarchaeota archaeon]